LVEQATRTYGMPGRPPGMGTTLPIVAGCLGVATFVGLFATWSTLAPLESAAVAPGIVSVETKRKTIKHLEGGIIKAILVREDERVTRGQTLIVLDPTQAKANLALLRGRQLNLRAREARLLAERSGRSSIEFPALLPSGASSMEGQDSELAKILEGEIDIFKTRRERLTNRISILEQQNAQISERIKGYEDDVAAKDRQLKVVHEEITIYEDLLEKGLTQKPRVLELQRRQAELEGNRSQNLANISQAREKLYENRLRVQDLQSEAQRFVAEELRKIQTELLDLESKLAAATDILDRTVVTAPLDGTVVDLRIHTKNGVVRAGDPLLDIVPREDRLLVDAHVNPKDIDVVHPDLQAKIHLTPFLKRHVRPLEGRVISVSADRLTNERSGENYYLARIELNAKPDRVTGDPQLYPGMPAEVMIITGQRTLLEYILEPITRSLRLAFRED